MSSVQPVNRRNRLDARERLITRALTNESPQLALPGTVIDPIAHAVLIRGLASWPDDLTFEKLETFLTAKNVNVVRYSYAEGRSQYEPVETLASVKRSSDLLAKCIQDFKDDCPIWIFAHSFGGIVAANWLCRELVEPNHAKLKESVKRIFLFASPIFPNYDFFRVEHPTNKETLALYLGEYIERSPTLLDCYTEFVVGYSPEDKMARIEEVLFSRHLPQASHFPAEGREVAISDTDHFTICNHEQVLGVVSHWCGL